MLLTKIIYTKHQIAHIIDLKKEPVDDRRCCKVLSMLAF